MARIKQKKLAISAAVLLIVCVGLAFAIPSPAMRPPPSAVVYVNKDTNTLHTPYEVYHLEAPRFDSFKERYEELSFKKAKTLDLRRNKDEALRVQAYSLGHYIIYNLLGRSGYALLYWNDEGSLVTYVTSRNKK